MFIVYLRKSPFASYPLLDDNAVQTHKGMSVNIAEAHAQDYMARLHALYDRYFGLLFGSGWSDTAAVALVHDARVQLGERATVEEVYTLALDLFYQTLTAQ